jgi:hypothetical protein
VGNQSFPSFPETVQRASPYLLEHFGSDIDGSLAWIWRDQVVDIAPRLGPHVAQEMGRYGLVFGDLFLPVMSSEFGPDVGVKLKVKGPDGLPQALDILLERVRLVIAQPISPRVAEIYNGKGVLRDDLRHWTSDRVSYCSFGRLRC